MQIGGADSMMSWCMNDYQIAMFMTMMENVTLNCDNDDNRLMTMIVL